MEVKEAAKNYKRYTCEEADSMYPDERLELIDGAIYLMSSPLRIHQGISGELFKQLAVFLTGKPCKVYSAPFDVFLDNNDITRVVPDIVVVCDESKLTDKGCDGAPDMIIEILSPSTTRHDKIIKFNKYLQAGVREYWIVDPGDKTIATHILKNGEYVVRGYDPEDSETVSVHVLENCLINIRDVFTQ